MIEPNHITYFRFVVCLLLLLYSYRLSYLSILILAILGGLSDFFDGAFARSASKKTRLGVLIDPLADKALIFTIIYILIMKKVLDPLYVLLIAIMETHLIIAPLLSWFYGLLRRWSHEIPYSTSKVKKTDVILARAKPVFMGRVKINLYVYAILSMMLGKIYDSMFLMNLANLLLVLGICAGGIAFGIYMMRWSKELHPLS